MFDSISEKISESISNSIDNVKEAMSTFLSNGLFHTASLLCDILTTLIYVFFLLAIVKIMIHRNLSIRQIQADKMVYMAVIFFILRVMGNVFPMMVK